MKSRLDYIGQRFIEAAAHLNLCRRKLFDLFGVPAGTNRIFTTCNSHLHKQQGDLRYPYDNHALQYSLRPNLIRWSGLLNRFCQTRCRAAYLGHRAVLTTVFWQLRYVALPACFDPQARDEVSYVAGIWRFTATS